jgi:hypothetical protein
MDLERLNNANDTLEQSKMKPSKELIKLIIAAVIVLSVITITLVYLILTVNRQDTYPYIPNPKNTLRSTSKPELVMNLLHDLTDTATLYSVVYRAHLR